MVEGHQGAKSPRRRQQKMRKKGRGGLRILWSGFKENRGSKTYYGEEKI